MVLWLSRRCCREPAEPGAGTGRAEGVSRGPQLAASLELQSPAAGWARSHREPWHSSGPLESLCRPVLAQGSPLSWLMHGEAEARGREVACKAVAERGLGPQHQSPRAPAPQRCLAGVFVFLCV